MESFENLGLSEETLKVIKRKGFEEPTPIQVKTIPAILAGDKDIVVGTPGRILDNLRRGTSRMDKISCLVPIETDKKMNTCFHSVARAAGSVPRVTRKRSYSSVNFSPRP